MTALKMTGIRQPRMRFFTVFPRLPNQAVQSAARSVASEPKTISAIVPVYRLARMQPIHSPQTVQGMKKGRTVSASLTRNWTAP